VPPGRAGTVAQHGPALPGQSLAATPAHADVDPKDVARRAEAVPEQQTEKPTHGIPSAAGSRLINPSSWVHSHRSPAREVDSLGSAVRHAQVRPITVLASLGLRRGELFALRWSAVSFDEQLVYVRATNHRGVVTERTKSKAGTRIAPLF
jgi:hypothetical protein